MGCLKKNTLMLLFFYIVMAQFTILKASEDVQVEFSKILETAKNIKSCNEEKEFSLIEYIPYKKFTCKVSLNSFLGRFYNQPDSVVNITINDPCALVPLGMKPVKKVRIDNLDFYLGPIFKNNDRNVIVSYSVGENGCIVPHILYKSISDGGWRTTSGFDDNGRYQKGAEWLPHHHYVQETKPHQELVEAIESVEASEREVDLKKYYELNALNAVLAKKDKYIKNIDYGDSEKQNNILSVLQSIKPGHLDKSAVKTILGGQNVPYKTYQELFLSLDDEFKKLKDHGFIPDFTKAPTKSYKTNHTIWSADEKTKDVSVEVFMGKFNERPVEWHIATEPGGRVWIDRIAYKDCKITPYGNCRDVIDSGLLTNKPVEYAIQCWRVEDGMKVLLPEEKQGHGPYLDITPLLSQLMPIREYREAKKEREIKKSGDFSLLAKGPLSQERGLDSDTDIKKRKKKMQEAPILECHDPLSQSPVVSNLVQAVKEILLNTDYGVGGNANSTARSKSVEKAESEFKEAKSTPALTYSCTKDGVEFFKLTHGTVFGRLACKMGVNGQCDEGEAVATMIRGMPGVDSNRYVSRYHFMTYMKGDKLVMRDFSLNQTKIGDNIVRTDAQEATVLGDEFDLNIPNPDDGGQLTFTIHCKKQ